MTHPENKRERFLLGEHRAGETFQSYYGAHGFADAKLKQRRHGVLRKTRKLCSSPFCCGNPRRQKGKKNLTMQERKALGLDWD